MTPAQPRKRHPLQEWADELSELHSLGDNCPTCKDTFLNRKCAFVQIARFEKAPPVKA